MRPVSLPVCKQRPTIPILQDGAYYASYYMSTVSVELDFLKKPADLRRFFGSGLIEDLDWSIENICPGEPCWIGMVRR